MKPGKNICGVLQRHLDGEDPAIPEWATMLWRWFADLSLARTWHAAGPNPITWSDIAGYRSIVAPEMQARHIMLLRQMDQVFVGHFLEREKGAPEGVKSLPPVSSFPMTPALFDAMVGR